MSTIRVGMVSLSRIDTHKWRARWTEDGREVQRRLYGTQRDVIKIANHITENLLAERGYVDGQSGVPGVRETIATAIRLSQQNNRTQQESSRHGEAFSAWLEENYSSVRTWDQIKPVMVQEYARTLESRGLAHDSIRLALLPIKSAWRFASENFPEVRPLPKIVFSAQRSQPIDPLSPGEISVLLEWLRTHAPHLWPIATLQALAGLRILEAAFLRRCDIDLSRGIVAVQDTDNHKLKTPSSNRVLPVCQDVLRCLETVINDTPVVLSTGEVFLSKGQSLWTKPSLGAAWRRYVQGRVPGKETNPPLGDRIAGVPQRKLRSSFATIASRLGVPAEIVSAYLGHSATDMLGKHYRKIGVHELGTVADVMADWRNEAKFSGQNPDTGVEVPSVSG